MPGISMSRMARSKRSPSSMRARAAAGKSSAHGFHAERHGLEPQQAEVRLVVVHQQDALAAEHLRFGFGLEQRRLRAGFEHDSEREHRAMPDLALDLHRATHDLDEAFRDRESETRAAEATRGGGVDLLEALEEPTDRLLRDADPGVPHREARLDPHDIERSRRDLDRHLAPFGELDCVADQIHEDLTQARHVAHHRRG